ncbi:MAG: hypothetical protein ACOVN7_17400 [Rubrivivax sp.]|jgi:hypothetical protein
MTESLTEDIAASAARLVVESGLEYGAAKHKAARALGRRGGGRLELPSNEQVEDEVRAYIDLFLSDTQPAELAALREVALGWMQRMAGFRPHLSGAVWRGTATRESAVHIDLYCDDSKAAEIALLNMGVDHDIHVLDAGHSAAKDVLSVSAPSRALGQPVTVHLIVHDRDDLRGALKPDARGRTWRGDLAALKRLLTDTSGAAAAEQG